MSHPQRPTHRKQNSDVSEGFDFTTALLSLHEEDEAAKSLFLVRPESDEEPLGGPDSTEKLWMEMNRKRGANEVVEEDSQQLKKKTLTKRQRKSNTEEGSILTVDGKLVVLTSSSDSTDSSRVPHVSSSECSEEEDKITKAARGRYNCSKCGASKAGHVCSLSDSSVMVCSVGIQAGGEDVLLHGTKTLVVCRGGTKTS